MLQQLSFSTRGEAGAARQTLQETLPSHRNPAPQAIQFTVPWETSAPSLSSRTGSRIPPRPKSKNASKAPPPPALPRKRVTRPGWNHDVKQQGYFDQALVKTKLFNAPKKLRDALEAPPKPKLAAAQAAYTPSKRATSTQKKPPPANKLSVSVPRVRSKPPVITTSARPSVVSKPTAITRTEPIAKTLPSVSPHLHDSAPLPSVNGTPHRVGTSSSPSSPVRKSNNQEDKDDHVIFPSFPPPPLALHDDLPPPRNRQLIESTFRVIDTKRKGQLHAREIHQGLQLLGITSTMRQIADYLYLVNDGRGDTIGLSEWSTLVQTLQSSAWAASSPPPTSVGSYSPQGMIAMSHMMAPSPTTMMAEPQFADDPMNLIHERTTVATQSSPLHALYEEAVVQEQQPFHETWFIDQIERRINDMFGRAEAAAALRWNNHHVDGEPQEVLRRAAHVVHGLKSSLYPLVHQAEETLKAIQARHASNLSVFLSPREMAMIASQSEDLCDLLLDDLLTDTATTLGEIERRTTVQQIQEADILQWTRLLEMIETIEVEEAAMAKYVWLVGQPSLSPQRSPSHCIVSLGTIVAVDGANDFDDDSCCVQEAPRGANAATKASQPLSHAMTWTTANVAKMANRLDDDRQAFLRTRRIAEASLVDTGLTQSVVIELLEGMVLDDVLDDVSMELDVCFGTLGTKIAATV
ncbi:Aste57867_9433 [Aphanomyces stellatus]|uniref:Aste57867_9433 protein n=1 Tax=Aphanomyces stellatus TaxID=120398 RepID=A0A485KN78_9STRA|nr:hypothetical protein As57867_009397 [Aphanomyces stellatus]VFT86313.1 Aste57867_9433 [Aphanomyces stellatus]